MKRVRFWAGVILILWLATALNFHTLAGQSFWNDEGNSARLSERTLSLIIAGTASDVHPPLYYLLLRGWREMLGESEFGLRALSAFAGVGVVAATVAVALSLARRQEAVNRHLPTLVAGLLAALNPALVYYAQEARMYALLALWAILSTLLLARLLRQQASIVIAAAYVVVSVAGLYTHYFYPAVLLWQNGLVLLWLLVSGRYRFILRWIVVMLVTFLLYLPWLPIFFRQVGGRAGADTPALLFLREAAQFIVLGPAADHSAASVAMALAAVLLLFFGISAAQIARSPRADHLPAVAVPTLGLIVPPLSMLVAGITNPAFYKFLLVAVPFFALAAGAGFTAAWGVTRRLSGRQAPAQALARVALPVVLAGLAFSSMLAAIALQSDPAFARADYRGIAARIAAQGSGSAIILNAANQWEVFTYYYQGDAPVFPLPAGRPDEARIAEQLTEIAAAHDRIYVVFWGEAERDPQRLVERWLDANAFKAGDEWVGDVRLVTYAVPDAPATTMETALNARFGDLITLPGFTLASDRVAPGEILQLALFWQTEVPLDSRYKVFLHLVDEQGAIIAQRDSEPGGGLALTTTGEPGVLITDNHGVLLPTGTPPGDYRLLLGLYDAGDPSRRLPVFDAGGAPLGDSLLLATISVR